MLTLICDLNAGLDCCITVWYVHSEFLLLRCNVAPQPEVISCQSVWRCRTCHRRLVGSIGIPLKIIRRSVSWGVGRDAWGTLAKLAAFFIPCPESQFFSWQLASIQDNGCFQEPLLCVTRRGQIAHCKSKTLLGHFVCHWLKTSSLPSFPFKFTQYKCELCVNLKNRDQIPPPKNWTWRMEGYCQFPATITNET